MPFPLHNQAGVMWDLPKPAKERRRDREKVAIDAVVRESISK